MEISDNLRFTKLVLNNGLAFPALGFGTLIWPGGRQPGAAPGDFRSCQGKTSSAAGGIPSVPAPVGNAGFLQTAWHRDAGFCAFGPCHRTKIAGRPDDH